MSVGLITEYNPFHLGHAYQIEWIRKKFPSELLVIVMSGNIVQRGEFAILDKWQRAELALQAGADLVIELPLLASMQSADYFAKWSVDLLHRLDVDNLVFGTEAADIQQLMTIHHWIQDHQAVLDQEVKSLMNQGKSYAYSTHEAIRRLDHDGRIQFPADAPNQLLGLKYIEANQQYVNPMVCHTLVRKKGFLSGSQIRKKFAQQALQPSEVPAGTWQKLKANPSIQMSDYFEILKYQLMIKTDQDLANIYSMREGFEKLLKREIRAANDYEDFINRLTSKRWTRASVQRVLMNVLLNIQVDEWKAYEAAYQEKALVRVLGFKELGREYLAKFRDHSDIQLISNLTKDSYNEYGLMIRTDDVFGLKYKTQYHQNIGRFPVNNKVL